MSPVESAILLFALMLVLMVLGCPIAFCMGAAAVIFGIFAIGTPSLVIMFMGIFQTMRNIILVAVPLFILMGGILETSGIAAAAYKMAYKWSGGLRGGLAVGTIIICTIFAACTGISGAATVAMGLIALPAMLSRGYDKSIAIGSVMAGGALGVLIPPSIIMIVYALQADESVGRLFAGGVLPGFVLSGSFIFYIIIRCALNPTLGPALPPGERVGFKDKLLSLKALILPVVLIIMVLGSIFTGFATPTEAAGVGAIGAILCAAVYRGLNLKAIKSSIYDTTRLTAMVMWIVVGATCFTTMVTFSGTGDLLRGILLNLHVPPITIIIIMQISYLVLGCFMDPTGIIMLTAPIYVPVVRALGFDVVWFGVLWVINMEMAYLTPPFGVNLFYMQAISPKGITMTDIYKSAVAFISVQFIVLILAISFPNLILWLPNLVFGTRT